MAVDSKSCKIFIPGFGWTSNVPSIYWYDNDKNQKEIKEVYFAKTESKNDLKLCWQKSSAPIATWYHYDALDSSHSGKTLTIISETNPIKKIYLKNLTGKLKCCYSEDFVNFGNQMADTSWASRANFKGVEHTGPNDSVYFIEPIDPEEIIEFSLPENVHMLIISPIIEDPPGSWQFKYASFDIQTQDESGSYLGIETQGQANNMKGNTVRTFLVPYYSGWGGWSYANLSEEIKVD